MQVNKGVRSEGFTQWKNKSGVLDFSKTPLQYPEPGSNRHGSESTGV